MKKYIAVLLMSLACCLNGWSKPAETRPNIILLFIDDLAVDDIAMSNDLEAKCNNSKEK